MVMNETMEASSRRPGGAHRGDGPVARTVFGAGIVLGNAGAVVLGTSLLWLNAGTTVVNGDGTRLTVIFFLCALLHGIACVLAHRLATHSETTAALVTVTSLTAGVVMLTAYALVTHLYFAEWVAGFASLFVAASSAVSAIIGVLMSSVERWVLHLIPLAAGFAGFLLTGDLWLGNGLLAPLLLFVTGFVICGRFFGMIALVAGPKALIGDTTYRDRADR